VGRNLKPHNRARFYHVFQGHHLAVCSATGGNRILEALSHTHSFLAASRWPKEQEINNDAAPAPLAISGAAARQHGLLHGPLRRGGISGLLRAAGYLLGLGKEGLGLARLVLDSSQLILLLSLLESEALHQTLDTLDVRHVQVDFLLEDDQVLVHFDLQVVPSCFNLCF
jgi:hypothetical protein